jgi:nucleotide-binding universal stress UspA family protein
MAYRTIVVHLDAAARRAERLELACSLAAGYDAHLVGLFALAPVQLPFAFGNAGAVIAAEQRWRDEVAALAERELNAAASRHGVAKLEWRTGLDAASAVCASARYADLVIIGQREPGAAAREAVLPAQFVEETVLRAGRPVLIVPYAGRISRLGARVLVAWDASREAARAVTDALPLLQGAQSVEVVAFDPQPGAHGAQPGADIALYLARHRVKVTAAEQHAGVEVGGQILSRAADHDVDLIVMGAYGHSRARELVMGGATRTLLASMTVPVLMSH